MALHANSDLDPESLLHTLLSIEAKLGRKRSGIANEPRPMDMDPTWRLPFLQGPKPFYSAAEVHHHL